MIRSSWTPTYPPVAGSVADYGLVGRLGEGLQVPPVLYLLTGVAPGVEDLVTKAVTVT